MERERERGGEGGREGEGGRGREREGEGGIEKEIMVEIANKKRKGKREGLSSCQIKWECFMAHVKIILD